MNRHYRIILLISILILGGLFLFFYKVRNLDFGTDSETKFFMRNLSWQTDFRPSVPYKTGDDLEYVWVFSGNSPRDIMFDITSLKNKLSIEHIFLDDVAIEESALNNISVKDSSLLKITGKAKNVSTNAVIAEPQITVIENPTKKEVEKKEVILPIVNDEPTNIVINQTRYNSNINNLVSIAGENLESIEFVNIGEKRIRPIYSSGTLFVQINRDTFSGGEYFVFFTLKNGKIITSDFHFSFEHSASPINIANITPTTLRNNEERFVVIQGNGFDKIISIQLSNNLILKNAEFKIINSHVAGVKIPKDLPIGEYYFNIMDISAIYEVKNMRFTITH